MQHGSACALIDRNCTQHPLGKFVPAFKAGQLRARGPGMKRQLRTKKGFPSRRIPSSAHPPWRAAAAHSVGEKTGIYSALGISRATPYQAGWRLMSLT